jgi:hypothetical protein
MLLTPSREPQYFHWLLRSCVGVRLLHYMAVLIVVFVEQQAAALELELGLVCASAVYELLPSKCIPAT